MPRPQSQHCFIGPYFSRNRGERHTGHGANLAPAEMSVDPEELADLRLASEPESRAYLVSCAMASSVRPFLRSRVVCSIAVGVKAGLRLFRVPRRRLR